MTVRFDHTRKEIVVICEECGDVESFKANDLRDGTAAARAAGWRFPNLVKGWGILCPKMTKN